MGYGNLRNDQRNALLAAYCYWTHSLILKFNSAYLVPQGPGTWLMAVLNRGYLNRPRLTCIQVLQAHQQPVVWQKLKQVPHCQPHYMIILWQLTTVWFHARRLCSLQCELDAELESIRLFMSPFQTCTVWIYQKFTRKSCIRELSALYAPDFPLPAP